jgi:hypothetical protein
VAVVAAAPPKHLEGRGWAEQAEAVRDDRRATGIVSLVARLFSSKGPPRVRS